MKNKMAKWDYILSKKRHGNDEEPTEAKKAKAQ